MKNLFLISIGILAGFLSGLLGIGGGVIIIPALVYFMGFSQKMAQGTSLAALIPPVGLLATYRYWQEGNVNIKFAVLISLSFLFSAYLGADFVHSIPEVLLKRVFGFFMLVISIKMIFNL